jgi:hypothetical protein
MGGDAWGADLKYLSPERRCVKPTILGNSSDGSSPPRCLRGLATLGFPRPDRQSRSPDREPLLEGCLRGPLRPVPAPLKVKFARRGCRLQDPVPEGPVPKPHGRGVLFGPRPSSRDIQHFWRVKTLPVLIKIVEKPVRRPFQACRLDRFDRNLPALRADNLFVLLEGDSRDRG